MLRVMLRGLSEHGYMLQEDTHSVESGRRLAYSCALEIAC